MTAMDKLAALRAMAGIDSRNALVEAVRSDVAEVIKHWRGIGEVSEAEAREQLLAAQAAIQAHVDDTSWLESAARHFGSLAEQIRRDKSRSSAIRHEARVTKPCIEAPRNPQAPRSPPQMR